MSAEYRSIKMPGSLLDKIKEKENKGDYVGDRKYNRKPEKKRKSKELGRKEKRKEERKLKKQKLSKVALPNKKSHNHKETLGEESRNPRDEMTEDDTWDALKALKRKKSESHPHIDLSENESDLHPSGFSEEETSDAVAAPQTVEETMAALKAAKEQKRSNSSKSVKSLTRPREPTVEETMTALKELKAKKSKGVAKIAEAKSLNKKERNPKKTLKVKTAAMKEDEAQMEYYAKKLGLSTKDRLQDTGDGLDSLLDGLDFDFDSEAEESGEEAFDEQGSLRSSDDEINSSDFDDADDDIDSGDLRELKELEDSENFTDESLTDEDNHLSDKNDTGEDSSEENLKPEKENPYVAPESAAKPYVPPALARRMAEAAGNSEDEEKKRLKRSINSSLNKLSEANFATIVTNELGKLYSENPRLTVTECLSEYILGNIKTSSRLLDSFIIVYAGVVGAFFRLQGVEFGAHFIQKFVETLETYIKDSAEPGKEATNLIALFGFVFNFQVFSSKLIFDIIRLLCVGITEMKIEMLLKLVTVSGQKLRQEDPSSLKDIIILATQSINKDSDLLRNSRATFLLETLQNVKNNKFRNTDQAENNNKIITSLKKQLQTISTATSDPIQVTLDDIRNIETKGKWWLVGSAWKGREENARSEKMTANEDAMNDILDSAELNWNELADTYRMNTSIRKAIFIAIMSSEGFEEASVKINKLGLRGNQKFEVSKILLLCCSIEPHYNPFYGYLAKEFCSNHDMRKSFQFNLWDLIKEFEGANEDDSGDESDDGLGRLTSSSTTAHDEEINLKKILSLGKLYGFLIGQNCLPLTVLKTVNFVTATEDTKLFLEIMLVIFLDNVGKASELSTFGTGSKKNKAQDMKFDDKKLIEKLPQGQPVLLRGLQYFLQQKVRASELISGRRQTRRIEWGCDTLCDVIDEFLDANHRD